MSIEEEKDSKYLSALARIDLSPEEEEQFNRNLAKILDYMRLLDEVDTQGILPSTSVLETISNVTEEDQVGSSLNKETFLKEAPDVVGGMVKVPPVMQEE